MRVPHSHLCVSVSFVLGFLLWLLSPLITGQKEAWESEVYYLVSLTISGFVSAALEPGRSWLVPVGVLLGQVVYIGLSGQLAVMIFLMLAYPLLFAVGGTVVGAAVGVLARRLSRWLNVA